MSITATIVAAPFTEHGLDCLAIRVTEEDGWDVEYIGRVPLSNWDGRTEDEQRTLLPSAAKAVRDAETTTPAASLPMMRGTVTL